jgi:hypothetical protein
VDAQGHPIPFHLHVTAPERTRPLRAMIEHIIAQEKPAHVTWELAFAPDAEPPHEDEWPIVVTGMDEEEWHG